MNYKYCPNCGAKVNSSAKFCILCGYKFKPNDVSVNSKSNLGNHIDAHHKERKSYSKKNYDHVLLAIIIFICLMVWIFLMDSRPFLTVPPFIIAFVVGFIGSFVYSHLK